MPADPTSGRRRRTEEFLKSLVTCLYPTVTPGATRGFLSFRFLTSCASLAASRLITRGALVSWLCVSGLEHPARLEPALLELTCCQVWGSG